jgi:hypothetical protein
VAELTLPLSELRQALLSTLASGYLVTDWASTTLLNWGLREQVIERGHARYEITDYGRVVLKVNDEHGYTLRSRQLGRSPIAGGGPIYGSGLSCRCGWRAQNNERPASKYGNAALKREHRQHVTEALVAALTSP